MEDDKVDECIQYGAEVSSRSKQGFVDLENSASFWRANGGQGRKIDHR
jgi:hypothetical protein